MNNSWINLEQNRFEEAYGASDIYNVIVPDLLVPAGIQYNDLPAILTQ